jgi:metallophosphoesterase superfamily enzyme
LLGDVKHRVAGYSWRDAIGVRKLVGMVRSSFEEVVVLPGNHDGGISELLAGLARIEDSRGIKIGDYWLMHGHTWPHPGCLASDTIVIGHTHPTLRVRSEDGTVRTRVHLLIEGKKSRLAKELASRPGYSQLVEGQRRRGRIRLVVLAHFSPPRTGRGRPRAEGFDGHEPPSEVRRLRPSGRRGTDAGRAADREGGGDPCRGSGGLTQRPRRGSWSQRGR